MQINSYVSCINQDTIQQYNVIKQHFNHFILNLSCGDSSNEDDWLCDFNGCGLTENMFAIIADQYDMVDKTNMLYSETKALYHKIRSQYWENYIKRQILSYYNISLHTINTSLSSIFENIMLTNHIADLQPIINNTFQHEAALGHNLKSYPPDELANILKTTTNSSFYSKHTGISIEESQKIICNRELSNFHIYKAYRPHK